MAGLFAFRNWRTKSPTFRDHLYGPVAELNDHEDDRIRYSVRVEALEFDRQSSLHRGELLHPRQEVLAWK